MAVKVTNHEINLNNGLSFNEFYLRLEVSLNNNGDVIRLRVESYLNKEKYISGGRLQIPYRISNNFPYNREVDGTDILSLAHEKVKSELIEAGIPEEKITIVDITI